MPEPAAARRDKELTPDERATIEAALAKVRADGGNPFLEMQLETALQEPRRELPKEKETP